jgi:ATP-dependent Lon protease
MMNKITKLKEIVKNIIRANHHYKSMKIIEATDLNLCVKFAENIYFKLTDMFALLTEELLLADETLSIDTLQHIIGEISTLISLYGCDTLENLIYICIGHSYKFEGNYQSRYDLLNTYVHPMAYKTLDWKTTQKPKDDTICKTADNLECFDIDPKNNVNFKNCLYTIKIIIHNIEKKNTIVIYCMIEDVLLDFIEDPSIKEKIEELNTNKPTPSGDLILNQTSYERFVKCLTLKELLVHPINVLHDKYLDYAEAFINDITKKPLLEIINAFEIKNLTDKRTTLIMLLINSNENECHYLAYLLYDLLSNDINGIVDTYDQTDLYESLPYTIKKYFHEAMKSTSNYTKNLSNIESAKLSLEQRICLMKTDDTVKEKAMVKLKEVKMKAEDTGSKAMQYLDGLLKIPFGIYKEEPILKLVPLNSKLFAALIERLNMRKKSNPINFPVKATYTNLEVQKYYTLLKTQYAPAFQVEILKSLIRSGIKKKIMGICNELKDIFHQHGLSAIYPPILSQSLPKLRAELEAQLDQLLHAALLHAALLHAEHFKVIALIYEFVESKLDIEINNEPDNLLCQDLTKQIKVIEANIEKVNGFMKTVGKTLDSAVYGHTKAKRQIERIIGQWLNGDITGYCFGFEGPPGVGKTSLAKKGIAGCLRDENNVARPFSFIAMGGSTNSSTLDGHNYTYVGSSWGRIVDILMDTKIMNPIIFIDELDKVSKTENGKEIIGILTHLIDQTQNDAFHDKYFNGINLNLSRALFIFSYNDVDAIDKILLDRIHRIKFDPLTVEDKLVITRNFILPEIYQKMGLNEMIQFSDEVIEFIIDDYTSEPGVRKLKELMFEIMGEINLDILAQKNYLTATLPIVIQKEDIKQNYLKDHHELRPMKIHHQPLIGVINGMWANSVGKGGILPIEASFYPCPTFLDLKLTGMQGDVMKESMTVAKSLAWSLFSRDAPKALDLRKKLEENKNQGLHIHVPEGATPKDGPSAGTAITMVLYSLFSDRKIKNNVAITGEICLQGRVTAIGGLELKFLGGIRAGVKLFIYPKENEKDFKTIMEKYGGKPIFQGLQFFPVETIDEVIPLIF